MFTFLSSLYFFSGLFFFEEKPRALQQSFCYNFVIMKNLILIAFLLSTAVFTGCSYPMEELGLYKTTKDILGDLGNLSKFSEEKITFDLVKRTAMSTCMDCHSKGAVAMGTAEQALNLREAILEVVQTDMMPPRKTGYSPLSACEKQILETWMDDQVNNRTSTVKVKDLSACGGVTEAPKPKQLTDFATLELSFENLKKEILEPKCLSCHTQETAKRTVLETAQDLFSKPGLITTSAETSVLYLIVVPDAYKRFMPPVKSGIAALTPEETDYLKRWIESQAQ